MLASAAGPACRLRRIAAVAAFLVASCLGLSAVADTDSGDTLSVRPFFASPSLDTTPVDVQMRGVRWRVPRNFLESAELYDRSEDRARRINSAALRIVTTLSTLKGATPETLPCYKALRAAVCPDTIIILAHGNGHSASVWNRQAIIEAAGDPRDDVDGLTKVNTQVSVGAQDVYVFYGGSLESNSTVIACTRWIGREQLQDCSVRFEISGLSLRYTFAKSQLPHWERIHTGVLAIVKSFAVGDTK